MIKAYILKRAQHHAIATGFNFSRMMGAVLIYAAVGFSYRKEPPIYVLFVTYLLLQVVAWIYDEVEMYRREAGMPLLWQKALTQKRKR